MSDFTVSGDVTVTHVRPKSKPAPFWFGVFVGLTVSAVADLTDLHICFGQCDGKDWSLLGLYETPLPKKTDRLPLQKVPEK
ncbi:hypothetical protein [Roseibium sp. TrichSKD4]|uniref:hypothetical protein n=1 Tax=Roseibium sp. TrichSKD4 TaxID=744980 RepID=UPI00031BD00F|nr:hypothetical protein [Roseibium sp. TrichSKD4]